LYLNVVDLNDLESKNKNKENGFHRQAIAPRQDLIPYTDKDINQNIFKYLSVDKSILAKLGSHSQAIAPDRGSGSLHGSAGSNIKQLIGL
jgi:hypothetical protein